MSEPRVIYFTDERTDEGDSRRPTALIADEPLPASLLDYLRERRRALITELRKIEQMLDMEQSIPARKRPH